MSINELVNEVVSKNQNIKADKIYDVVFNLLPKLEHYLNYNIKEYNTISERIVLTELKKYYGNIIL